MSGESESIELQGELCGHNDWVTCIATPQNDSDILISGSRDKTIVVWQLSSGPSMSNDSNSPSKEVKGKMLRRLTGHNGFIEDIDISNDSEHCLSASWDRTLRLWNLKTGKTTRRFKAHEKDVLSCAFSADNRHIVSGSRDRTITIWNTLAEPKEIIGKADENGSINPNKHSDWVTCTRFSPNAEEPVIVSSSRDGIVKVWKMDEDMSCSNLKGHTSYVNAVTISPDGSLCASGGKDGKAMLWDLNEAKSLSCLDAGGEIHALTFSPNRYWLCGAVGESIKIWDLETKEEVGTLPSKEDNEQKKKRRKGVPRICTCLAWSHNGKTLFAGYTDNRIRVWSLISPNADDNE